MALSSDLVVSCLVDGVAHRISHKEVVILFRVELAHISLI